MELTLLEICAQNQGNSISGDLKCKSFLGGMPRDPPRRDRLWRSIITIRLLRNFCQLLEKLWTTLLALVFTSLKKFQKLKRFVILFSQNREIKYSWNMASEFS